MVVCKFFLQGYCKFGDNCKFEHQISDNFGVNRPQEQQQHSSVFQQSHFNSQFQNPALTTIKDNKPTVGNVDINALVKSVVNDMVSAEKGGQWLLSCYAPFKEKPLFPGFEEYSFEEVRCGFYDSKNLGTLEQYKQQIAITLQQAMMRIKTLQNPSNEILEILKNIYNSPTASQNQTQAAFPTTNTNTSPFAQNFSSPQASGSNFAPASQSLFKNPQEQQQSLSGSIFGGEIPSNNVFTFQGNTNVFNQNQPMSSNIFAQGNALQSGSLFAEPTTNTGSFFNAPNQNTNIFAQQPPMQVNQTTSSNMFALPNFNTGQQQMPLFGNQQPTEMKQDENVFATFQQPSNPLLPATIPEAQIPNSGNVFGSQPFSFANQGNQNQFDIDEGVYSKIEDLTEEEIRWFESDDVDVLNIPEKPPTREMCFDP